MRALKFVAVLFALLVGGCAVLRGHPHEIYEAATAEVGKQTGVNK